MDKLSAQQRHANMAAIRSKDTKPEMVVRRGLWSRGFRYRLNYKRLPGHPDLVLRKYRTCIFVNGCFWHGHHINLQFDDLQFTIENSECCKIPIQERSSPQRLTSSRGGHIVSPGVRGETKRGWFHPWSLHCRGRVGAKRAEPPW